MSDILTIAAIIVGAPFAFFICERIGAFQCWMLDKLMGFDHD